MRAPAATGGPGRTLWPGSGAERETFSLRRKPKTQLGPSGISEKHSSSCRACVAQTHGVPLLLGGRVKTWKRRWFILTDNCLYYFEYTTVSAGLRVLQVSGPSVAGGDWLSTLVPQDKEPRGIIPLENLSIREVEDPRKPVSWLPCRPPFSPAPPAPGDGPVCLHQNCFELYNPSHKGQVIKACKTEADGRVVEGNHVVYRISAPSPEEKEEWMKSIRCARARRGGAWLRACWGRGLR